MPYALITRPMDDAKRTQADLAHLAIDSFIEPLLTYTPIPAPLPDCTGASILLTSAHAIPAIKGKIAATTPILAIGDHTAVAAQQAGFIHVNSAGGDVRTLLATITGTYPATTRFVYLRGEIVAYDLATTLQEQGYIVEEVIVYRMEPATSLSPRCTELLERQAFQFALFYSARTAETFVDLTKKYCFSTCAAVCLSPRIADALLPCGFQHLHIANTPDHESLLEIVAKLPFTA